MTPIALIVACAQNNVIGRNGRIPWHLPEELRYFKEKTLNKPIVMGHATYNSLKSPLKDRYNIILTQQCLKFPAEVKVVHTFENAIQEADDYAKKHHINEIMVIGGAQLYQQALPLAEKVYLTQIDLEVSDGDTFFPVLDEKNWQLSNVSAKQITANGSFRFCIFTRI